ncbi:hypothetical protein FQA39_LY03206 [Lamprigera yunnana]|nr:hypothetical protein FQA39_LY03206 [Lamprigera yunnana]
MSSSSEENSSVINDCSLISYFSIQNDNSGCDGEEPIAGPSGAPLVRHNVTQSLSRFFEEIDTIDSRAKRSGQQASVVQNAIHFEGSSKKDEASKNPYRFTAYIRELRGTIKKRRIVHYEDEMTQLEDLLKVEANAIFSSLPGTSTTFILSTIAPTRKTDVGVQELIPSVDIAGQIEALFGLTELEAIGGTISQFISINTNTLRSEGAVGSEVVKLEVYPLKDVIGLPKGSWWKKATMSFPLMECVNRSILMWNEPSCEPASFETLKMLFGGDSCNVKVKYESDTIISRTPIIILANNDPFPRDEAFRSRMIYYKWCACPMLKDYKKQILPLAYYYLLEMYDIFNSVEAYMLNDEIIDNLLVTEMCTVNNEYDDIFNLDEIFNSK